jgi:hypothetical protein
MLSIMASKAASVVLLYFIMIIGLFTNFGATIQSYCLRKNTTLSFEDNRAEGNQRAEFIQTGGRHTRYRAVLVSLYNVVKRSRYQTLSLRLAP